MIVPPTAIGDDYLKGVAPMAATFPWMMGPGNHEADCNYTVRVHPPEAIKRIGFVWRFCMGAQGA
jgi:hypothetical protein